MNLIVYQIENLHNGQMFSSFLGISFKTQNLTFDFLDKQKLVDKVVNPRYYYYKMYVTYVEDEAADIAFEFENMTQYREFLGQLQENNQ